MTNNCTVAALTTPQLVVMSLGYALAAVFAVLLVIVIYLYVRANQEKKHSDKIVYQLTNSNERNSSYYEPVEAQSITRIRNETPSKFINKNQAHPISTGNNQYTFKMAFQSIRDLPQRLSWNLPQNSYGSRGKRARHNIDTETIREKIPESSDPFGDLYPPAPSESTSLQIGSLPRMIRHPVDHEYEPMKLNGPNDSNNDQDTPLGKRISNTFFSFFNRRATPPLEAVNLPAGPTQGSVTGAGSLMNSKVGKRQKMFKKVVKRKS